MAPSVLDGSTPLTAILAIGSNAGPAQLARKFPLDLFPQGVVVPVRATGTGGEHCRIAVSATAVLICWCQTHGVLQSS